MPGIDSDLIRGHIDTIILNILAEGDRYGYEICKEVEIKSNGTYELKQPTLYSCLKRLEDKGLISSYWEDSDIGGKRHYYKLTDEGIKTYKQNQEDWRRSREIIDSLISAENNESESPAPQEQENEEIASKEEPLIFEEIDKEVENQDNGFADNASSYLESETDESKAIKEGFESEESEGSLPFDDNNYDEYCAHLVKNGEQNDEDKAENNEENPENSGEEDDILALLGHYSEPEENLEQTQEVSKETEENDYSVNEELANSEETETDEQELSQEDAFLAKFITGKYSEYNPNKDGFLSSSSQENEENAQNVEPDGSVSNKTEDEFASSDEEEFGSNDNYLNQVSYFDNNTTNKVDSVEPTLVYDKPEEPQESEDDKEISTNQIEELEPEQEETEDYSPITYFNLNKPQYDDVSEAEDENTLKNFASKYDAPYEDESDEDDDVVLDFSKPSESEEDSYTPSFTVFDGSQNIDEEEQPEQEEENEEISPENETISSSLTEELNDQEIDYSSVKPFENPGDTTSVYDKANAVNNITYTDVNAKEKLNGLTNVSINPNILNTPLSADETKDENLLIPITEEKTVEFNTPDLSNLKETLSSEGINVKPYYKQIKEPESTKTFIETNKIKMIRNWITFFIETILLGFTLLIISKFSFSPNDFAGRYAYFLGGLLFFLAIAVYSTVVYWINPYKKVTAKYAPRLSHLFALIFTIQFFVIIYCINLQFGFFSFAQTDYNHLNWIVPCVVCISPIIRSIIYEILYKSKNFHV